MKIFYIVLFALAALFAGAIARPGIKVNGHERKARSPWKPIPTVRKPRSGPNYDYFNQNPNDQVGQLHGSEFQQSNTYPDQQGRYDIYQQYVSPQKIGENVQDVEYIHESQQSNNHPAQQGSYDLDQQHIPPQQIGQNVQGVGYVPELQQRHKYFDQQEGDDNDQQFDPPQQMGRYQDDSDDSEEYEDSDYEDEYWPQDEDDEDTSQNEDEDEDEDQQQSQDVSQQSDGYGIIQPRVGKVWPFSGRSGNDAIDAERYISQRQRLERRPTKYNDVHLI